LWIGSQPFRSLVYQQKTKISLQCLNLTKPAPSKNLVYQQKTEHSRQTHRATHWLTRSTIYISLDLIRYTNQDLLDWVARLLNYKPVHATAGKCSHHPGKKLKDLTSEKELDLHVQCPFNFKNRPNLPGPGLVSFIHCSEICFFFQLIEWTSKRWSLNSPNFLYMNMSFQL